MFGKTNNYECLRWFILWNNNIEDNTIIWKEIILNDIEKLVLSKEQISLIPFLNEFKNDFFLAWGTAIALHLWHRESIDFDLFTFHKLLKPSEIIEKIEKHNLIDFIEKEELKDLKYSIQFQWDLERTEYILHIKWVQIQFVFLNLVIYEWTGYNFKINHVFFNTLKWLDIENLIWMKLFALSNRNKWKDIIDMYIILNIYNLNWTYVCEIWNKMYWNILDINSVVNRIFENNWNKTEEIKYIWEFTWIEISEKNILEYFSKIIEKN